MLNIDGKEISIKGLNFDGFEKSDVAMAFSYGDKSIDFKKKGSEIKSLLYSKKVMLDDKCRLNHAKCVALKKEICDMLGKDCDDEMEHMSIYGLQCSDECKACIMKFNQCLMECESIKRDCKTIDTLIKHLEDGKTYSLSLPQMQSIEKAETFYKGSAEQSLKIAEEVLKQFHDGELVINGKKASKEEAMKIAMERAGLKREEVEKCGATMEVGDVVQKADMDESFDLLMKGGRAAVVGEIRNHGGVRKKKMADGSWQPVKGGKTPAKKKPVAKKKTVAKKVTPAEGKKIVKGLSNQGMTIARQVVNAAKAKSGGNGAKASDVKKLESLRKSAVAKGYEGAIGFKLDMPHRRGAPFSSEYICVGSAGSKYVFVLTESKKDFEFNYSVLCMKEVAKRQTESMMRMADILKAEDEEKETKKVVGEPWNGNIEDINANLDDEFQNFVDYEVDEDVEKGAIKKL